ncbi:hypothetical protein H0H87_000426 [Tephrocybe sp. NHM501043]|nr:hypothetical protein H0H87_000426 [Tephrocybe sp. NHM501043]
MLVPSTPLRVPHSRSSIYISEAEQYDLNITETWKADMDSTLIFAGLFSATVTAFIIEGYKLLQQDSSDVTNILLIELLAAQIKAANSSSSVVMPSALPIIQFIPSRSSVTLNILWFLSLAFSLAAALSVTLVQQWVRDYLQRIQRHNEPLRRARVRTFVFNGIEKWKMDVVVEYIPTLLHISLFLFFAGLYIFLVNINDSVSIAVAAVFLGCVAFYGLATLAPLLDPAAPYETPLTALLWRLLQQFGAHFAHQYSAQYRQHSSFEPTTASSNLTGAREQLALNPAGSSKSLSQDAQAFKWAYATITNDRELEAFIESIPGFLGSKDGRQTWAAAFQQLSSPLEDRITELLTSCSKASYMDTQVRRRRATLCIEALSAISRYQTQDYPYRPPEPSTISHLSRHIKIATKDHYGLPVTNGVCTLALLARQYLMSKFRSSATQEDVAKVIELSRKADDALKDVDDMRQSLERVLQELSPTSQDYKMDVGNLLQLYFGVVEAKSYHLLDWGKVIGPKLYEFEQSKQHTLLSWYSLLPNVRHFLKFHVSTLCSAQSGLELYAHQVLAFMRHMGAYPKFPSVTDDLPAPAMFSSPWFPLRRASSKFGHEYDQLWREFEPISLLLSYLEPHPMTQHVDARSKKLDIPSAARSVVHFPKKSPLLTEYLSPFSTVAFILEDVYNGARIVTLLELVMEFKFFAPKVVEAPVMREMLDIVFPRQAPRLRDGSQVLFVAVLRVILDWERDAPPNKPCAFTESDITLLINSLKRNLSCDMSLDNAERLLGTSFIPDSTTAASMISVEESRKPLDENFNSRQSSPNIDRNARIQSVIDHLTLQRLRSSDDRERASIPQLPLLKSDASHILLNSSRTTSTKPLVSKTQAITPELFRRSATI